MRLSLLLLLVLLTKSSSASHNGISDELRFIHQEMGALRAENQQQNFEIAALKETVQLQNKTINQHEATIKELIITDDHKMTENDLPVSSAAMSRRKKPARLLPSFVLRGKRKNDTDQEHRSLFYGPPTNCSDLTRLGYTLNGFYMVKKPKTNYDMFPQFTMLDAVYCTFKQEGHFNPSNVEQPVIPSPFTSSLMQNPTFHSPILPSEDDVYFRFSAVRNKDHTGILTFDQSMLNQNYFKANGFDGKTGYFTAPMFGIYHFLYEALSGSRGNGISVDFYLNDVLVVNPLSSISKDLKSLQVTLKLKTLDTVCLKATIRNNSDNFSTFPPVFSETVMGYLLKTTYG